MMLLTFSLSCLFVGLASCAQNVSSNATTQYRLALTGSQASSVPSSLADVTEALQQTASSSGSVISNGLQSISRNSTLSATKQMLLATGSRANATNANITAHPTSNHSMTLPTGLATRGNSTFKTSCAYTDASCYSTCSQNYDSCSFSWAQYNVLYTSWLESMTSAGLIHLSYSETAATTTLYKYTLTSYLVSELTTTTTYYDYNVSPTTYTTVTTMPGADCAYVETTYHSAYTVTMSTNNCTGTEQSTTFTTTVTKTNGVALGDHVFEYAISTIGVYSTRTIAATAAEYTTITSMAAGASSFSIAAPNCASVGCVGQGQIDCGNDAWSCSVGVNCNLCTIYGGTVQLLYWPVSASTAASNGTLTNFTTTRAPTPTSTGEAVEVYEGTTLTSPSVYISFNTVYALNDCNSTIGQAHTGSIIGLDPTDLSSAVGDSHYFTYTPASGIDSAVYSMGAASFDLANLNWPYNGFAWMDTPQCHSNGGIEVDWDCQTILDVYNPVLVVPSEIRNLDPAWASCALDWEGLYAQSVAASATLPIAESTTKASAAATPTSPNARSTAAPDTSPSDAATSVKATAHASSPNVALASTDAPSDNSPSSAAQDPQASSVDGNDPATSAEGGPAVSTDQTSATTTGLGDIIASVIGVVASTEAAAGTPDQGDDGSASNVNSADPIVSAIETDAADLSQQTQNVATFEASGNVYTATLAGSSQDIVVLDGQTASAGGSGIAVAGQTVSLGSSGIIVANQGATSTVAFQPASQAAAASPSVQTAILTAGDATYTASSSAGVAVIDGQTLRVGASAAIIQGQTVSLGSAGIVAAQAGVTSTISFDSAEADVPAQQGAMITIYGSAYTVSPSSGTAVIAGTALSVGGSPVTVDGQTISLGSAGVIIASDGKTSTTAFGAAATGVAPSQAVITLDDARYTALETAGIGSLVVDGVILSEGGPATTINGKTMSVGDSGIVIASDGTTRTVSYSDASPSSADLVSEAFITIGSRTLTAYGIAGQTGQVMIDGAPLSIGGSAVTIVGVVFTLGKDGLVQSDDGKRTTLTSVGISKPALKSVTTSRSERLTTSSASAAQTQEAPQSTSSNGGAQMQAGHLTKLAVPYVSVLMLWLTL